VAGLCHLRGQRHTHPHKLRQTECKRAREYRQQPHKPPPANTSTYRTSEATLWAEKRPNVDIAQGLQSE
jgi:hypothetical protein